MREEEEAFKNTIAAWRRRWASCKSSPSHHVVTSQACKTSVMSVRAERRPTREERMTEDIDEPKTGSDMYEVPQAMSC